MNKYFWIGWWRGLDQAFYFVSIVCVGAQLGYLFQGSPYFSVVTFAVWLFNLVIFRVLIYMNPTLRTPTRKEDSK